MTGIIVVKIGGKILENRTHCRNIAAQLGDLSERGHRIVAVHGGGGLIAEKLRAEGLKSRLVRGMRVTDAATMEVVEAALTATANKRLVRAINDKRSIAVGLSGQDGSLLQSRPLSAEEAAGVDYGRVGMVDRVCDRLLHLLLDDGFLPVLAPVGVDAGGEACNINADMAAAAIAGAMGAKRLVLASDVSGVLDATGALIPRLTLSKARQLIDSGTIKDGMIPKAQQAMQTVRDGVSSVQILDGRQEGALIKGLDEKAAVGTLFLAD